MKKFFEAIKKPLKVIGFFIEIEPENCRIFSVANEWL